MRGKNTTVAIVLILLVGFPLASYLYLRKGMNFRLDAIAALQVKSHLPITGVDEGPAYAALIVSEKNQTVEERLSVIRSHFADRGDVLYKDIADYPRSAFDSLMVARQVCSLDGTADVFLVNKKHEIVNCYRSADELDMTNLVEHIAFLIPPDPEKDFEFKRSKEK